MMYKSQFINKRSGVYSRKKNVVEKNILSRILFFIRPPGLLRRLAEEEQIIQSNRFEEILIEIKDILININHNITILNDPPCEKSKIGIHNIEYEIIDPGQTGDLCRLISTPNIYEPNFHKDFFHWCKAVGRSLIKLEYDEINDEHKCPLCNEIYLCKRYDLHTC